MCSWKRSKELREFDENSNRYVCCRAQIFLLSTIPVSVHLPLAWLLTMASLNFHADKKKLRIIPKWLTPNPLTQKLIDFYFISRIHGCSLRFEFTHFYNITSTFHEVSSVSSKSSVAHSNETFSF